MTPVQSQIIEAVCQNHGQRVEDILSKSRLPEFVRARHEAMYQLYKAGYSKKEIGRIWNTGHTTAIKAIKKVESDKSKLASSQYEEARLEVLRMGF
jgi:chromosomal replication initiation ATPase DnaA